jgi:hypothetical protein
MVSRFCGLVPVGVFGFPSVFLFASFFFLFHVLVSFLYTSCMLRSAFMLFINLSSCLSKKNYYPSKSWKFLVEITKWEQYEVLFPKSGHRWPIWYSKLILLLEGERVVGKGKLLWASWYMNHATLCIPLMYSLRLFNDIELLLKIMNRETLCWLVW